MRLNDAARDRLREAGITFREWGRHYPNHDACGCSDDRCIGFHHGDSVHEVCGCLEVMIAGYRPFRRPRGAAPVPCPYCGAPGAAGECY